MNDELIDAFNNQCFTKDSAIVRLKDFNPEDLMLLHVSVEKR